MAKRVKVDGRTRKKQYKCWSEKRWHEYHRKHKDYKHAFHS